MYIFINKNLINTKINNIRYKPNEDPWADSPPSFNTQRSNDFVASFEDYNTQQSW